MMKIAVFLSALVCSTLAAPNLLGGVAHSAPPAYSYPSPAVAFNAGAAPAPAPGDVTHKSDATASVGAAAHAAGGAAHAAGGAAPAAGGAASAAGPVVAIVKDDRVNDVSGTYSFDVAGDDGTARQENGAPLPEGGISQVGSYTYIQADGTPFELKYTADANGFQPESAALPALPQFVLDQIEFAKNNPEPEAAAGTATAGGGTTLKALPAPPALAPPSVYAAPDPAAPAPAAPAPAAPGTSYLPPGRR